MPFIDKRSWATSSDNISYSPHSREIEREREREREGGREGEREACIFICYSFYKCLTIINTPRQQTAILRAVQMKFQRKTKECFLFILLIHVL